MEDKADTGKKKFWNFIDNFKGDKVIWMIVLFLILISLVVIFASSTGLTSDKTSRMDIFVEQFRVACFGLLIIIGIYNIPKIGWIKFGASLGFLLSAALLFCLIADIGAETINGATRSLKVGGAQIHIFEIIKVSMVMYLAWAVHTYKNDGFKFVNFLADAYPMLSRLGEPWVKRLIFIYLPIIIVCGGMFKGGISSSLFCGLIMVLTVLIGGMPKKEIFITVFACLLLISIFVGIYFISDGAKFGRVGTAINRVTLFQEYKTIKTSEPGSKEYKKAMDKIRQPEGAKLAVKQGGLIGKGPGNSSQKYSVYAMYEDYIYSFIIEEWGMIGGAIVLLLYVSILARGALIVRFCDSLFAKTAVAGLVLLISGQALMHMFINVNIGPLTGQTLPLVSHGDSSFLCFSVAFGVLLSISRLAKKKMSAAAGAIQTVPEQGPEDQVIEEENEEDE